jgi:hypothetical protein
VGRIRCFSTFTTQPLHSVRPAITFSNVVFPAPLGPMIAHTLPLGRFPQQLSRIVFFPTDTLMSAQNTPLDSSNSENELRVVSSASSLELNGVGSAVDNPFSRSDATCAK